MVKAVNKRTVLGMATAFSLGLGGVGFAQVPPAQAPAPQGQPGIPASGAPVDPDNQALRRRTEEAQAMRDEARPTLPSTIADERACNPFLRCGEPAVIAAAQAHATVDTSQVTIFAAIRSWRNNF